MKQPILITGCARSGTSMVAGIMHKCGAFGGRTTGPTHWNKRGQYENDEIRENVIKPYLVLHGADPKGQYPLPDPTALMPVGNLADKIHSIMKWHGYKGNRPWYYKGAKLTLIWPLWHAAFPKAKWLIVRRPDADIVSSCMHTAYMNNRDTEESWQEWVEHHKTQFAAMSAAGLDMVEVWPDKFMEGNFQTLAEFVRGVGLYWNDKTVRAFVSKDLWGKHHG